MPEITSELLMLGMVAAAFLFFNYANQQAAKKAREAREQAEAAAAREASTTAQSGTTDEDQYAWGRTPAREPAPEAPPQPVWSEATPEPVSFEVPTYRIEPQPAPQPASAPAPAPAPPSVRPRRHAVHGLFASQQDLRRAVIAMTVLGPCRALEPPEQR